MERRTPSLFLALLLAVGLASSARGEPAERPGGYLGVYGPPVTDLAELAGIADIAGIAGWSPGVETPTIGLEVALVLPGSAADAAGIEIGDVLLAIDGEPFDAERADPYAEVRERIREQRHAGDLVELTVLRRRPRVEVRRAEGPGEAMSPVVDSAEVIADLAGTLEELPPGARLELFAVKSPVVTNVTTRLQVRPEERAPRRRLPTAVEIFPSLDPAPSPIERFADLAVRHFALEPALAALEERLGRIAASDDSFRLDAVRHVQREPFDILVAAREVLGAVAPEGSLDLSRRIRAMAAQDRADLSELIFEPMPRTGTLEDHAEAIVDVVAETRRFRDEAFAGLAADERAFLAEHLGGIASALADGTYLHADEDEGRRRANLRVLALAERVDRSALAAAALSFARLADVEWIEALRTGHANQPGSEAEEVLRHASEHGDVLFAGTGRNVHRGEEAIVVVDLGGDDIWSDGIAAASFDERPVAAVIDLDGNDSHASTIAGSQAAGLGGVALLVDGGGDDRYLATDFAQGVGVLGAGLLLELGGDDEYRARRLAQGMGLWGLGLVIDADGDDRLEGLGQVQGVGLPGGVGLLHDLAGDDRLHASGGSPTAYRTAGVFDAWSQGCGFGFRGLQSGGLGLLVDDAGSDHRVVGNFGQGGGYWFGWGIVHDRGEDDDIAIASRYGQGFSAHQALGTWIDEGGDDTYSTEHGVIAGLAWDESVSAFVDCSGRDTYRAGFFSLGASAHSSLTIFIDGGGRDEYSGTPLGRAGPNTYHDGASLSFALDLGFGEDRVEGEPAETSLVVDGETGVVGHLPGRLEQHLVPAAFPRVPTRDARKR